eukprot:UN07916
MKKLQDAFNPLKVEIIKPPLGIHFSNESRMEIRICAKRFQAYPNLKDRNKWVVNVLKEEMKQIKEVTLVCQVPKKEFDN